MADSPPPRKQPGPPREPPKQPPDGVVLFDPAPPPPLRPVEPERSRSRGSLVALLLVALGAGGYLAYERMAPPADAQPQQPTRPIAGPPTRAESLTPSAGGRLEGRAGSPVTIEVRATGTDGRALADTVVSFRVVQGGGLLELDAARTDSTGLARTVLLLPRAMGGTVVGAEVPGTSARATIAVEALAGIPSEIRLLEGDQQSAEVGELLPVRTAVMLVDDDGNPVPGAEVRFEVRSGGGISAPRSARTDSLGQASALWRLGPEPGTQQLSALSPTLGSGSALTFQATAAGRPRAGDGTPVPVEAGPVTVERQTFVVGGSHVCQLSGGATTCRGANDRGQRGTQSFAGFVSLATGISHMCGLDAQGVAMCWGANDGGQLGDGSRSDRPSPVPVRTELRFASLTAGSAHTCGLAGGGIPLCWGQNLSGQLGDGTRTDSRFPRAVGNGLTFTTLVAGWSHTCGLTPNGIAFCWGLNSDGQLGDGSRLDRLLPEMVRGDVQSLAAGSAHTCGLGNGQVFCWGDNRFGQVGDGSTEGRLQPTPVTGLPGRATQVVAGAVHSCALMGDGAAYCWGQNLHGQLGDGTTQNRSSATEVAGTLRFRSIHAGGALTCGTATSGGEFCWGLNQAGQLGDGSRQNRSTPTSVER